MTLSSMTGFARVGGGQDAFTWTWELRSVNGRGLDLRCRLPAGYEALEVAVRAAAAKRDNWLTGLKLSKPGSVFGFSQSPSGA